MNSLKKTSLLVAALGLAPLSSHAAWVTFGNATGWTNDIVVGAGETGPFVNGTIDNGPGFTTGFTFYGVGANPATPTSGLPTSATASLTGSGASFQLQPFSNTNNAAFSAPNGTSTLTLAVPTTLTQLALYGTTGNAGSGLTGLTLTVTITFADATTQVVTGGGGVAQDWFFNPNNVAYIANGRVGGNGAGFSNSDANPTSTSNPRIYESLITLTNTTSPVVSVTIKNNGRTDGDLRGFNAVLAISGNTVPEPSAALLTAGLGLLGLARRRRA